ncbi:hypothetical protein [Cellulomonas endometrii]|uniref:hypothetical protein n=1 Tax=Cellulomonas endometrii TaxID=3036301 RepID=UPI0024ADD71D|nr:hypothetical protein [Cellulomonas endometrii]
MGSKQRGLHYFVGANEDRTVFGHAWRLWAHGTSFYVAARDPSIQALKFSLHGPDPRPGLTPSFRLSAFPGSTKAALRVDGGELPMFFPGRRVPGADGVRHVMKFRFTHDAFLPRLGSGRGAGKSIGPDAKGIIVTAPPTPAQVSDLDLYVSDGDPHIPPGSAEANALVGPIRNDAGQTITGVSRRFPMLRMPTPAAATSRAPLPDEPAVRGVWMGMGGCGYAWVVEGALSARWFEQSSSALRRPDGPEAVTTKCALAPPWGWGPDVLSTVIRVPRVRMERPRA